MSALTLTGRGLCLVLQAHIKCEFVNTLLSELRFLLFDLPEDVDWCMRVLREARADRKSNIAEGQSQNNATAPNECASLMQLTRGA